MLESRQIGHAALRNGDDGQQAIPVGFCGRIIREGDSCICSSRRLPWYMALPIGSCKWEACQNMAYGKLATDTGLPKWVQLSFFEVCIRERWDGKLSQPSEKYAQGGGYSWYIVTYVVQCRQSLLVESSTLSLSSMTTEDAEQSIFSRTRLKS